MRTYREPNCPSSESAAQCLRRRHPCGNFHFARFSQGHDLAATHRIRRVDLTVGKGGRSMTPFGESWPCQQRAGFSARQTFHVTVASLSPVNDGVVPTAVKAPVGPRSGCGLDRGRSRRMLPGTDKWCGLECHSLLGALAAGGKSVQCGGPDTPLPTHFIHLPTTAGPRTFSDILWPIPRHSLAIFSLGKWRRKWRMRQKIGK